MKKKSIIGKIMARLFSFFLVILTIFVIIITAFRFIAPNKMINYLGIHAHLTSNNKSMEPLLKYNDLVVIKKHDFNKLGVGDIISFKAKNLTGENVIITNKIVEVIYGETNQRTYKTKGINQDNEDMTVVSIDGSFNSNEYVGKYIFKSTILGHTVSFFRHPIGATTLIFSIILMSIILREINKINKNHQDKMIEKKTKKRNLKLILNDTFIIGYMGSDVKNIDSESSLRPEDINLSANYNSIGKTNRKKNQ